MVDKLVGGVNPERIRASRPVALFNGLWEVDDDQVLQIWVSFRGEDRFPARPLIDITNLTTDEGTPHLTKFTGKECEQDEARTAWGDGVEVQGVINNDRRTVVLTEIGGVSIPPEADLGWLLDAHYLKPE